MEIITPSAFIQEWVRRLAPALPFDGADARRSAFDVRRALDVAMGRGRHAIVLARAGFKTFGVDVRLDAVRDARARAMSEGHALACWCADLTRTVLPIGRFDLIVVTRYLQRGLFPALEAALAANGVILCETFTVAQRALGRGPTSPDHLLERGELRRLLGRLEILFEEEVLAPDAVARVAARRPR
jgi:tellurite methyltransferase